MSEKSVPVLEASLEGPYLARKATDMLSSRIIDHLKSERPAWGTPFYSESQLMKVSGLSRFTIRRVMSRLSDEGWIERRAGKGTFVGPRVMRDAMGDDEPDQPRDSKTLVRLAVLMYARVGDGPDWYSHEVLRGIDEVAGDLSLSIELLGDHTGDISVFSRRLEQSRPDALVVMPSRTRHALMIGEAQRLGIPCVLTGTRMLDLELPTVCNDDAQGAAMAVKHLFDNGHRRIGLQQRPDSNRWVFDRRRGYVQGITECGLQHDERLVLWLTNDVGPESVDSVAEYLEREKPTALLMGSSWHARTLGRLIKSGRLSIPQDLSIVTFDQNRIANQLDFGMEVTTVDLPLCEMGRRVAKMACDIAHRREFDSFVRVPCTLTQGDSVMRLTP